MSEKPRFTSYTPDQLRKLHLDNPQLFDQLAGEAIKAACTASSPEQSLKLQQMQWTIDMQIRKGKTPLARMHIMENIFYSRVYGDNGHLVKLVSGWNELLRAVNGSEVPVGKKPEPQRRNQ